MTRFTVHLIQTVSAAVEVEADDYEAAIEAAYQSDDMPGSITYGAFGSACVDGGDWEPASVEDENGVEVWNDHTGETS